MRNIEEFRKEAHQMVDWMADYLQGIEQYPVRSKVKPGEILNQLPSTGPEEGEEFCTIFKDFESQILKGVTHWQHPSFHAYFPGNSSLPSLLGEMLTSTLAAQCMIWETSPSAAELEERVLEWLKRAMGIPEEWKGVIQDTASTATLASILTAREKMTGWSINEKGFDSNRYRIYCSSETHSSIEKAVRIAGFGRVNLVHVEVDELLRLNPEDLRTNIEKDIKEGFKPLCVIATVGTTGTCSIDPLPEIVEITNEFNLWLHVDAAFAGTATLLEEYHWMINGLEAADSYVFNPHKWMFTNFDCTAYFVKDAEALIRTFEVLPEYLKTGTRGIVNDYRDWGIPLGRRFRALKLWFVIRSFGFEGIRKMLRNHLEMADSFAQKIIDHPDFELLIPRSLNVVCFRYRPNQSLTLEETDKLNQNLLETLNNLWQNLLNSHQNKRSLCYSNGYRADQC